MLWMLVRYLCKFHMKVFCLNNILELIQSCMLFFKAKHTVPKQVILQFIEELCTDPLSDY
jgi:hypothetical protein